MLKGSHPERKLRVIALVRNALLPIAYFVI